MNLATGRNPWKRASLDDATYRAYLKDSRFLSSILPISAELERILRRIFQVNPARRISMAELRELILSCGSFTAQVAYVPAPVLPSKCVVPVEFTPPHSQQTMDVFAAIAAQHEYALYTPPATPPQHPRTSSLLDMVDCGSDLYSDDVISQASFPDYDMPATPPSTESPFIIPPAPSYYYSSNGAIVDWKNQSVHPLMPSVACY